MLDAYYTSLSTELDVIVWSQATWRFDGAECTTSGVIAVVSHADAGAAIVQSANLHVSLAGIICSMMTKGEIGAAKLNYSLNNEDCNFLIFTDKDKYYDQNSLTMTVIKIQTLSSVGWNIHLI